MKRKKPFLTTAFSLILLYSLRNVQQSSRSIDLSTWKEDEEIHAAAAASASASTVDSTLSGGSGVFHNESFNSSSSYMQRRQQHSLALIYNATDMYTFVQDAFHGDFCKKILRSAAAAATDYHYPSKTTNTTATETLRSNRNSSNRTLVVKVSLGSCHDLFYHNHYGTGNFIMSIYILRSTALAIGNVHVSIQCDDAYEQRTKLILPWLTGWFPCYYDDYDKGTSLLSPSSSVLWDRQRTVFQRCKTVKQDKLPAPLAQRANDIRMDLRRMAVALVGVPPNHHPAAFAWNDELMSNRSSTSTIPEYALSTPTRSRQQQQQQPPLLPDIQLDDTVLHFRCGDLMDTDEPRYGFLKFDSYARHISPQVHSIGILTEPFFEEETTSNKTIIQHRPADGSSVTRQRCRKVVHALVERLHERFPQAQIHIRNTAGETIALVYARMVLANQTIVGTSTFAFFPAIATFGQAYVRQPRDLGSWIRQVKASNIVLFDDPDWLSTSQCRRMWGEDGSAVLEWFRSPITKTG